MAIISERECKQRFAKKKYWPIYYFYGQEQFKVQRFLKQVEEYSAGTKEVFYGNEFNIKTFIDSYQNLSLFENKKCITIRRADSINAKDWEALKAILQKPTASIVLLFCSHTIDLRKKHTKWLTKYKHIALVRCDPIRSNEVYSYSQNLAKQRGKKIHPEVPSTLQELCGISLYEIDQTLEKAALFSQDQDTIYPEHIEAVTARTKIDQIFTYSDAVISKNRRKAMEQLEYLYEQGKEPIALVGLLARQYRWMLEIQSRQAMGESSAEIIQAMKLFPRLANPLFQASKNCSYKFLVESLSALQAADITLKQSPKPAKLIMYQLTLQLTR